METSFLRVRRSEDCVLIHPNLFIVEHVRKKGVCFLFILTRILLEIML
jgi:hypothetical protein